MADDSQDFGFNIITECKEIGKIDNKAYQSGESSLQHGKQYTDDADILQSILKYSKDHGIQNSFLSRELSK